MKSAKKSDNARPKRCKRPPPGTFEIIEQALRQKINITENGMSRCVSVFEAILLQIVIKEMSGDKRATNLRLKFQEHFPNNQNKKAQPMIITIRGGLPDPPEFKTSYVDEQL